MIRWPDFNAFPTILVVTTVLMPEGVYTKDYSVTAVTVFWVAADWYMAFGFAATALWAVRFARTAERRLKYGLRVASVGLCGIVVADCLFIAAVVLRWASHDPREPVIGGTVTTLGYWGATLFLLPGNLNSRRV